MPSKPTEKCPYKSRFSPNKYVSLSQIGAEIMCERMARKEYKELPLKFWEIKKWRNILVWQAKLCSELRKKYRDDAIFSALMDKRSKYTYSFQAPWLIKTIEEYEAKPAQEIKIEIVVTEEKPTELRPSSGGNNLASLLD